jgi:hypothetical protein
LVLDPVGTTGARTAASVKLTDAVGAYTATIRAYDNTGVNYTDVVVHYAVAGHWTGLRVNGSVPTEPVLVGDASENTWTPLDLSFNFTDAYTESLSYTLSPYLTTATLVVTDPSTGKVLYTAPAAFTAGTDGYFHYLFDPSVIGSYIPTGTADAAKAFEFNIVFSYPLGKPKSTCGCGCGDGSTTITDIAVDGTPVAGTAATTYSAPTGSASTQAASGGISPLAATVSSVTTPVVLGANNIATIKVTGSGFGTRGKTTYVTMMAYPPGSTTLWTASSASTTTNTKLTVSTWTTTLIQFTTPAIAGLYGDFRVQVTVSGSTNTGNVVRINPAVADPNIRLYRTP